MRKSASCTLLEGSVIKTISDSSHPFRGDGGRICRAAHAIGQNDRVLQCLCFGWENYAICVTFASTCKLSLLVVTQLLKKPLIGRWRFEIAESQSIDLPAGWGSRLVERQFDLMMMIRPIGRSVSAMVIKRKFWLFTE